MSVLIWKPCNAGPSDKQVTFLLPKNGTQNETLDSDIEEGCLLYNISFNPGQTQQARRTRSNKGWRRRTWEPPTSCFSPSLRFSSPFSFSILLFFSWCNLDVHIMWRSWIIPKIVTWRLLDALFYYYEGSKTRQIYVLMEMSHFVCNNWFVPRIGKNALMDKLGAPHVKLQIIGSKLKNKMFDLCLSLCPWSFNSALRLIRMDAKIVNKCFEQSSSCWKPTYWCNKKTLIFISTGMDTY